MLKIGQTNILTVTAIDGDFVTFDTQEYGQLTAENLDFIKKFKIGEEVQVFLYPDGDTMKISIGDAFANINEFAFLDVVCNTKFGTFFDLGIDKDILCPFVEQKYPLLEDNEYLVYVYIDAKTKRLVCSTKTNNFLSDELPQYKENQRVSVLIEKQTDLGFSVIVENKFKGLLYKNEIFNDINVGDKTFAFVKKIREDNKIDLKIIRNDHNDIENIEEKIIEFLISNNNKMNITDNSNPDEIANIFGISKKNFKKAIGGLYRKKIIEIKENEIIKI